MTIRIRRFDTETNDIVTSGRTMLEGKQAIGALVRHRLKLFLGEYPFDTREGVDWFGKVLGKKSEFERESEIKRVISQTPGVVQLSSFYAGMDVNTRVYTVRCGIITQDGEEIIEIEGGI